MPRYKDSKRYLAISHGGQCWLGIVWANMTRREMDCAQGQGFLGPVTAGVAIISHRLEFWTSLDMNACG